VTALDADGLSKDGLAQAQDALQTADAHITQALHRHDGKVKTATGVALEELQKLSPRGEAARQRVQRLRKSIKEAHERVIADGYVREALEKVQVVTDGVAKLVEVCEVPEWRRYLFRRDACDGQGVGGGRGCGNSGGVHRADVHTDENVRDETVLKRTWPSCKREPTGLPEAA